MSTPIPFDFDKRFTNQDELLDFIFKKPGSNNTIYATKDIVQTQDGALVTEIGENLETELKLLGLTSEIHQELRAIEVKAIEMASTNPPDFEGAVKLLTDALTKCPRYASALNNRAQVYQLKAALIAHSVTKPEASVDEATKKKVLGNADMIRISAMSDLNQALMIMYSLYPEFAPQNITKIKTDMTVKVPVVLVQALCQRGILHRVRGNFNQYRTDMQMAAALGSAFAQQELVDMNPIAQLNSEMLPEILAQLRHK